VFTLVAACAALVTGVASCLLAGQRDQQAALLRPTGIPAGTGAVLVLTSLRRRQVRRREWLACQVAHALHERRPATGIIRPDAASFHRRPGQLPARRHRTGVHRPPERHVPVPDKGIQVHLAMMNSATQASHPINSTLQTI
jgi:hypothetical protein